MMRWTLLLIRIADNKSCIGFFANENKDLRNVTFGDDLLELLTNSYNDYIL